jgi:hypothetical protein
MIFKAEFDNIVNRIGLEGRELDLAELVWTAAERTAYGQSAQVPALFKPSKKESKESYELTKQDLMVLKHHIAGVLADMEESIQKSSVVSGVLWNYCDKEHPESVEFFKQYNAERNAIRRLRTKLNKLTKVQRKIKKLLSK